MKLYTIIIYNRGSCKQLGMANAHCAVQILCIMQVALYLHQVSTYSLVSYTYMCTYVQSGVTQGPILVPLQFTVHQQPTLCKTLYASIFLAILISDGVSVMQTLTESARPLAEMGLSETAHSVSWSNCSNRTLIASMNVKFIKIFDLRGKNFFKLLCCRTLWTLHYTVECYGCCYIIRDVSRLVQQSCKHHYQPILLWSMCWSLQPVATRVARWQCRVRLGRTSITLAVISSAASKTPSRHAMVPNKVTSEIRSKHADSCALQGRHRDYQACSGALQGSHRKEYKWLL